MTTATTPKRPSRRTRRAAAASATPDRPKLAEGLELIGEFRFTLAVDDPGHPVDVRAPADPLPASALPAG